MAFNPFESLRKNSKAILSVVTIAIMFIFVLSSGGGRGHDITDLIDRTFRGGGSSGQKLAEAYGKTITQRDIEKVSRHRTIANLYLIKLSEYSDSTLAQGLSGRVTKLPQDQGSTGKSIESYLKFRSDPKMQQVLGFFGERTVQDIDNFKRGFKEDSEEMKTLMDARGLMIRDRRRMSRESALFFESIPNRDANDRMNFLLLLAKADQWGFEYGRKSVDNLVKEEIGTGFTDKDADAIRNAIRANYREVTDSEIIEAVGDEFRARTVFYALLGRANIPSPGQPLTISGIPASGDPYEFYKKYQDYCSMHDFLLVALSAENLLKDKTKVPEPNDTDPNTKRELGDIYKEGRVNEPDPSSSTPGFKKPKEFVVQYLKHDPKSAFYDKMAPQVGLYQQLASVTAFPVLGGGVATNALLPIGDQLHQHFTLRELAQSKLDAYEKSYARAELDAPYRRSYNEQMRLDLAALTLGTNWLPNYSLGYLYHEATRQLDARERAKIGVPVVATIANGFPVNPLAVLGPAIVSYPPPPKLEPILEKEKANYIKLARERLPENDIQELIKTLAEKSKDANAPEPKGEKEKTEWKLKAETAKGLTKQYLESWAKSRGYTIKSSTKPEGQFTIANDPGLKELVEQSEIDKFAKKEFKTQPELARTLFESRGDDLYVPTRFPISNMSLSEPVYYVWRTEVVAPKEHGPKYELLPDEVKAAVKHEWRLRKARAILETEAKAVSEQVKQITTKHATNPEALKKELTDFAAQKGYPLISNVTKLSVLQDIQGAHDFGGPRAQSYPPGRVKESPEIPYPSFELTRALLELRNKPAGEVAVAKNNPQTVAYIGVLTKTEKREVEDFQRVFSRSTTNLAPPSGNPSGGQNPFTRDPFYSNYLAGEVWMKNYRELFERLKAEANFKETDAFRRTDKGDEQ